VACKQRALGKKLATPTMLENLGALSALLVAALLGACAVNDVDFSSPDDPGSLPGPAILSISRSGTAEGTVRSSAGGIDCGASCSATFEAGAQVTLTATPGAGAKFGGWSGGGCTGTTPTCQLTINSSTTVTATFNPAQHAVTVDLGGAGSGRVVGSLSALDCPGACSGRVAHGARLTLTAEAGATSDFVGWSAGSTETCSGVGPCILTITGPITVTATFARQQSLEVAMSGTGTGSVSSVPAGIACGADCSETYPPSTSVTLTASADADSTFMGFTGGCTGTAPCTLTVNDAVMVTAVFMRQQRTLTVTKTGAGAGTVTSDPAGISCGDTCAASFNRGSLVTLTASPSAGSLFAGWSGGGCTGTGACAVTLTAATTVTATFQPIMHPVTVTRAGTGAGTVTSTPAGINCGADCSESYAQGAMVQLSAAASAGSTFAGFTGGGCSGTGPCTVTVAAATSITATFTALPYDLIVVRAGVGAGTVTSSPAGINCGADCSES
jgi:hypothetical protein